MRSLILLFVFAAAMSAQQMPKIEPGVSHDLAKWRAAHYSDVRYKLGLTLEKMSPVLKGTIEIRVNVSVLPRGTSFGDGLRLEGSQDPDVPQIILDWRKIKGHEERSTISNVTVNGTAAVLSPGFNRPTAGEEPPEGGTQNTYLEHNEHLVFRDGVVLGENVIKLDFTSPILTSGSAITRYIDKEDGSEYIYSLFVPSDASTAFPVFDQPDLKARFKVTFIYPPVGWTPVTNTACARMMKDNFSTPKERAQAYWCDETQPISTYVFAFAAGPWERVSSPTVKEGAVQRKSDMAPSLTVGLPTPATEIYVRRSQAAKFKPHAAEVFRLNREAIKYLEEYFDYKFPFPKYDLVLIPEFPFGGMEHAGATFLREDRIIFPQEPTKNDYITRANLMFHEAAHQWFGDTVTMKWFDDLWLKEGFAEFMAYKTLEKVMPEYNAWKVFYERNKQAAYLTDSTKGTTPIYQEIANLNAAKSAYGNIVYRKAPSFLKQAEYYVSPPRFQSAVRAFLKKYPYANAGWQDLVTEFEAAHEQELKTWAEQWVLTSGVPVIRVTNLGNNRGGCFPVKLNQTPTSLETGRWSMNLLFLVKFSNGQDWLSGMPFRDGAMDLSVCDAADNATTLMLFPNYQDYGYGIFLLDDKSRDYVLKNIHTEKDDFLRTMMWGSLWDSVREAELDPKQYVELVVKVLSPDVRSPGFSRPVSGTRPPKGGMQNLSPKGGTQNAVVAETDESTIQTLLGRVSTAMRYYIDPAGSQAPLPASARSAENSVTNQTKRPMQAGSLRSDDLQTRVEEMLIENMQNASTPGQRITYYRAFLNLGSSPNARRIMKTILRGNAGISAGKQAAGKMPAFQPRIKDLFDIVTRLMVLGDPEAPKLLAELEKTETSDEAKRYAYAARAGLATQENKAKYWNDFINNKEISESWIEAAFGPWNSTSHADLTLPYLERALKELPNHKRNRKIFFVNGWLGAFIGGQRSEEALAVVNKFLADNPTLDRDLRLKILENVDVIERAVKIRKKFGRG